MKKLAKWLPYVRKFLVALTAALAQTAVALQDGTITRSEGIMIVLAFLGALGVYSAINAPMVD